MPDFRKTRVDLEALRTFVTVAQAHSFSAAAATLHKTTSAVSYRIKKLEDSVGAPLFLRTTRSVVLTTSGEILLEKASQIFEWLQTLPDELKQVNDGIEPQFTLVINSLFYEPAAAAGLLAHLHERYPLTDFKISQGVYMGVWDTMLHGGGQFAIGAPGFHTISNDFETEPLGTIHWSFVITPDHPLAHKREPLDNNELRRYPVINVADTSMRLTKRTAWRLPGQQELLVPDFPAKIACHRQGLGIGFLPAPMVREWLAAGQLVERSVVAGRSPSPFSIAWRGKGAGRITDYLRALTARRDPLIEPFLRLIDPAPLS